MEHIGNLDVLGNLKGHRSDSVYELKTVSAAYQVLITDPSSIGISASASGAVSLPDATTLFKGWSITISNVTNINNINETYVYSKTGTQVYLLKTIPSFGSFTFTCKDINTADGIWSVASNMNIDDIKATAFNAVSDWTLDGSIYYTSISVKSGHSARPFLVIKGGGPYGDGGFAVTVDCTFTSGNIKIRVPAIPDCRFAGSCIQ